MASTRSVVFIYIPLSCLAMVTFESACVKKVSNSTDEMNNTDMWTDEQRLLDTLMTSYSSETRPVYNASFPVNMYIGITLTQIFDLEEKNQVLTTNVWLDQEWDDEQLKWNPDDYNGLKTLRIPCTKIWRPDTVLYNSASDYSKTYMEALAMVSNDGHVFWAPIVKFRSTCDVDTTYFPFDDQICKMKLGSWAYDGFQVNVFNRSVGIDLSSFVVNGEWELIDTLVERNVLVYPCCPEPFPDVTFTIHIRRRTMYYLFNIILPCIMLSTMSLLGFWLHPESGEKVTLGLTVLLALSVFMLLIAESTPATSFYVPLIGIYLIAAMGFTSISIVCAVLVSGIHGNGLKGIDLPRWFRSVVIVLSKIMCMRLYYIKTTNEIVQPLPNVVHNVYEENVHKIYRENGIGHMSGNNMEDSNECVWKKRCSETESIWKRRSSVMEADNKHNCEKLIDHVLHSLQSLINMHDIRDRREEKSKQWEEAARVIDRALFWTFFVLTIMTSIYLLVVAPAQRTLR